MKHLVKLLFVSLITLGSMPLFAADKESGEVKQMIANLFAEQEDSRFAKLIELIDRIPSRDRIYNGDFEERSACHKEILEIKSELQELFDQGFTDILNPSEGECVADSNARASLLGSFVLIAAESARSSRRSSVSASARSSVDDYAVDRNSRASLIDSLALIAAKSARSSVRSSEPASARLSASFPLFDRMSTLSSESEVAHRHLGSDKKNVCCIIM